MKGEGLVPKITDFGLAKKLDEAGRTQTGSIVGTPSYMAPEQAEGKKDVGPSADVYALGAILYECLTGRPPFKAATPLETVLQVVSDDPVPPRQLNSQIPRPLEAICLKCLEKKPGNRYSRAADLAADLARFQEGEPVTAQPSTLMNQLVGALDRVQLQAQFSTYGLLLLWFAPLMFFPEIWITLVVANAWAANWLPVGQLGRAAVFVFLLAITAAGAGGRRDRPSASCGRCGAATWWRALPWA
jgi:hypothetical protein